MLFIDLRIASGSLKIFKTFLICLQFPIIVVKINNHLPNFKNIRVWFLNIEESQLLRIAQTT